MPGLVFSVVNPTFSSTSSAYGADSGVDEQVDVARAARPAERRGREPADQDVRNLGELEGLHRAPEHGGESLEIARRPFVYAGTGQHDVRTSKPRAATAGNALCTTVT